MEYHMPYGKDQISITIPDSVKQVDLKLPPQPIVKYPEKLLYSTFENPIQSETLKNILETNNPYTPTQLEYLFGSEITENYRITWNDQENGEFINYGTTSRGTPVKLNSIYANADLKILITDVTLHYFAGFGGDRKSIFPGVASASSINKNHSLVMHGIYPGQIEDNPIHDDMIEAAQLVGADFVVNVCLDSEGNILDIKSGALEHAFLEAVKNYRKNCVVPIKQAADLLLLSAGGHPFDGNYQQSMKAVMQCQNAVKPGGKILYFLKGDNGIGIPAFKKYLDTFPSSQSILEHTQTHEYQQGMHNAYYYRKFTEEHRVYYKTELSREYVNDTLNVEYVEDVRSAIEFLLQNVNLVYIIRYGTKLMIKQEE